MKRKIYIFFSLFLVSCASNQNAWFNGMNPSSFETGVIVESRTSSPDMELLFSEYIAKNMHMNEFETNKHRKEFDQFIQSYMENARNVNRIRILTDAYLGKYDFDRFGFPLSRPIGLIGGEKYGINIINYREIGFIPVELEIAEKIKNRIDKGNGRKISIFMEIELLNAVRRNISVNADAVVDGNVRHIKVVHFDSSRTLAEFDVGPYVASYAESISEQRNKLAGTDLHGNVISNNDLNMIVGAVLTHESVSMYLHPEVPGRVPVKVYYQYAIPGDLHSLFLYGQPVQVIKSKEMSKDAVHLEFKPDEQKIRVSLSYKPEGMFGYVDVVLSNGTWVVSDSQIFE